jgi:anti-sigma-K factor RskA
MTHENCESYRELLAAGALTALDAADARALTSHLERCADCRSEMNEWEDTVAFLALDVKPLEPSAQLRNRILASVSAEARVQAAANEQSAHIATPAVNQADSKVLKFERPPRDVWTSLRSFGALAATLIFGALIISLLLLWQQNRATRTELAQLSREMMQTQAQLRHERAVVELLTSPDARMARLAGTNVAPGAHAMLAYDRNGHAMLMAKGLPTAPKGMAYQLWYIKDNQKMPGKVFRLDDAGNGILEDQIPAVARDKAVFAITLEPENGVQVPTGSIYLVSAT